MNRWRVTLCVCCSELLVLGLLLFASLGVGAREIVVTGTDDRGTGTLRWALQAAQSGDTITFDPAVFSPDDPATIYPRSELPPILCGGLTIDASNAGIVIDGSDIPGDWSNGLQVYSSHNIVMGLQVVRFAGSGIVVAQGVGNTIGGDRELGEGPAGQGNLVSGNSLGIDLCDVGTTQNRIVGNLIGVQIDGQTPWPNHGSGIFIEPGATHNDIGPWNVIAYNGSDGVTVLGTGAHSNTITRNAIFGNGTGTSDRDINLLEGGNADVAAPRIDGIEGSNTLVGTAMPEATIEIFSGQRRAESFTGETVTDSEGRFRFSWDELSIGAYLLCTATDSLGNTSPLSAAMATTAMQLEESGWREALEVKPASELADNRIGGMWNGFWQLDDQNAWMDIFTRQILGLGLKRAALTINSREQVTAGHQAADMSRSETVIHPIHNAVFTAVADWGIEITYTLTFWDKGNPDVDAVLSGPRFQTETDILRYLDFVELIVEHFSPRVSRYEVWGEPNLGAPGHHIPLETYIELIPRLESVIHSISSEAKIHIGATTGLRERESREYLFGLLRCDVVRLADVIVWHPLYGESPLHEAAYYYDYPAIVREIKATAIEHGFTGEYQADEMVWWTHGEVNDQPWRYSTVESAKYTARTTLLHLGMDVAVTLGGISERPDVFPTIQHLCTVMAGHEAVDLPAAIDIETDGPVAHCAFRYPNGDRMLAVWADGIAQDEDSGVPATVTFPNMIVGSATGIDVLHGFEQELTFEIDGEDTIVRDLLVKDYPILIRLSDITFGPDYQETVGDGFHRLGDVDALGGGADRDGDGVPDDEDHCPDWPGSKKTNGC